MIRTSGNEEVDLKELMERLGEKKIDSILLEGGGKLNAAAFKAGIVNKVQVYLAGKIIGGEKAPTPVGGEGALKMSDVILLENMEAEPIGEDLRITGYPKKS